MNDLFKTGEIKEDFQREKLRILFTGTITVRMVIFLTG